MQHGFCSWPVGDSSSPTTGRTYDASDLGSFPLLTAVIKEGLRLLPPTPLGGVRVCTADDTQLCGHKVPKVGAKTVFECVHSSTATQRPS